MDQSTHDILKEVTRLVDKFCDSITAYQKLNDQMTKRFATLSDETEKHFERLSHQDQQHTEDILSQERKFRDVTESRRRKESYLVTIIAFFGAAITALFANMWHLETRKLDIQKMIMAQKFHQEDDIRQELHHVRKVIERNFALRDQLMDSMAMYRGTRDFGQKYCVNEAYAGKDPVGYQEKLFLSGYQLLGVSYKIVGIFSDDINKQVINFMIISSVDNGNVCAKNAVTEKQLRPLQININSFILNNINKLQMQKEELLKQLNKISAGQKSGS